MSSQAISPVRLAIQLATYFAVLLGVMIVLLQVRPDVVRYLPLGGSNALDVVDIALFVIGHLIGTIVIMLPITLTYRAMNYEAGFSKTFVRALIVLPICATTIVLLIQDSLALAFGLAALVAAVRFRVALEEAMDGIFIFAAICVGLAAGIGYLGVAFIMSVFFCFGNLILWAVDYGQNPMDDMKRRKKRDKLAPAGTDSGPPV